jgi:IS5 family transposase
VWQTQRVGTGLKAQATQAGQQLAVLRGKPGRPTEFGRVIWLDEVEGGIISRYTVLEGNPAEDAQLQPSLNHHLQVFQRLPHLLARNRGNHTTANER